MRAYITSHYLPNPFLITSQRPLSPHAPSPPPAPQQNQNWFGNAFDLRLADYTNPINSYGGMELPLRGQVAIVSLQTPLLYMSVNWIGADTPTAPRTGPLEAGPPSRPRILHLDPHGLCRTHPGPCGRGCRPPARTDIGWEQRRSLSARTAVDAAAARFEADGCGPCGRRWARFPLHNFPAPKRLS